MKSLAELTRRLAVAAFLLLAAFIPAAAQAPQQIPPEVLAPSQEAEQFFDALETLARSNADLPELPGDAVGEMDAVLDQMYARGERVGDWSRNGVDLAAVVAARDGGTAANMVTTSGEFGPISMYLADRPLDALLPAEWVRLWRHGGIDPGRASVIVVARASPKVILVERLVMRRLEQAWCRDRVETQILIDPDVAASELDMIAFLMTREWALTSHQRPTLCSVTAEIEPGVFRDRVFDHEGYRLPVFDAQMQPMRIVPIGPSTATSR